MLEQNNYNGQPEKEFKVPENYFSELPSKVVDRIHNKKAYPQEFFSVSRLITVGSICILLVFGALYLMKKPEKIMADLSTEELIETVDLSGIEESELIEEANLENDLLVETIEEKSMIEEYLIEQEINVNEYTSEL